MPMDTLTAERLTQRLSPYLRSPEETATAIRLIGVFAAEYATVDIAASIDARSCWDCSTVGVSSVAYSHVTWPIWRALSAAGIPVVIGRNRGGYRCHRCHVTGTFAAARVARVALRNAEATVLPDDARDPDSWTIYRERLRFRTAAAREWALEYAPAATCHECYRFAGLCRCVVGSYRLLLAPACDQCGEHRDDCSCPVCQSCGERSRDLDAESCEHCESLIGCCCSCAPTVDFYTPRLTWTGEPTTEYPYYVGIEVELARFSNPDRIYSTCVNQAITVKYDGSLPEGGREFNLPPIRGEAVQPMIQAITRAWRTGGAEVDSTCGTHVHVDMRDAMHKVGHVLAVWRAVEPAVFECLPRGRQNNDYCEALPWDNLGSIDNLLQVYYDINRGLETAPGYYAPRDLGNRYRALNLCSLTSHGTVEFRLFPGTIRQSRLKLYSQIATSVVRAGRSWPKDKVKALATAETIEESRRALRAILPSSYHRTLRETRLERTR